MRTPGDRDDSPLRSDRSSPGERLSSLALLAVAATLPWALAAQRQPPADLVVLNARVVTVDPSFRIASAVAVRGGVFAAVGGDGDVEPLIGPRTRVIRADGRMVIPGRIESHVHALGVAEAEALQPFVALPDVPSLLAWVRERAARLPAGAWIWTPRTFPPRLRERRFPTRAELDAAAPQHPVVVDGAYALAVNTAALRAADITAATHDPPGGVIVKDAAGAPTGFLRNVGALLARFDTRTGRGGPSLDWLARVHQTYAAAGITSIVERAASVEGYRVYEQLHREGRLKLRAVVTLLATTDGTVAGTERFLETVPAGFRAGDEWLKGGALKVFSDGGILSGTAFMRQPWGPAAAALYGLADPNDSGFLTLPPDKMQAVFRTAHRQGWQVCTHVTGDAGVDAVLDAFEAADRDAPIRARRFTLIHADFPNAAAARRAAALGVLVDTQPAWYYKDAEVLADVLGEDRVRSLIGVREWVDGGVRVVLNSDHMFGLDPNTSLNPFNPFLTMYVAVTRRAEGGRVIGPEQAVTREEALRMMTINAAYLTFDEARKGSIEVGKFGDLTILSDDLLTSPAERIRDIVAETTVVGGQVVYERPH
jgi:predicted amidohydrolase YtcJ